MSVWRGSEVKASTFSELIEYHELKKLVEMKDTYYTNMEKVFCSVTHIVGDTRFLCVEVKGQRILMAPKVWFDIVGS